MSWHMDGKGEDLKHNHHFSEGQAAEGGLSRNTLEFNPGPPTKSRKARSRIMMPGMHRTHPRSFA